MSNMIRTSPFFSFFFFFFFDATTVIGQVLPIPLLVLIISVSLIIHSRIINYTYEGNGQDGVRTYDGHVYEWCKLIILPRNRFTQSLSGRKKTPEVFHLPSSRISNAYSYGTPRQEGQLASASLEALEAMPRLICSELDRYSTWRSVVHAWAPLICFFACVVSSTEIVIKPTIFVPSVLLRAP